MHTDTVSFVENAGAISLDEIGTALLIDDFEEAIQSGYAGEILPLIKDALQLSTNTLVEEPFQLPPQLLGRLLGNEKLGDLNLLEEARHWCTSSWLRPISASLTQPGGLLKRTLTGHTHQRGWRTHPGNSAAWPTAATPIQTDPSSID